MTQTALIRPGWTPATIGLMVLGFVAFWPLGLAMLAYILWGDRLEGFKPGFERAAGSFAGACRGRGMNRASTGNVAFDEWRSAELDRLDEERRKLDEMRAEFDQHMRDLRMARDREEFEKFMAARRETGASKGRKNRSVPDIDA